MGGGTVSASCITPGACFAVSAAVRSCEAHAADGQSWLQIQVTATQATQIECATPLYRTAESWEVTQTLMRLEGETAFIVLGAQRSCDDVPARLEQVEVDGDALCCDTIPPQGACRGRSPVITLPVR